MTEETVGKSETRHTVKRKLQESDLLFRRITNSRKDAVIVVDNGGKITFWNPAAEIMFGYTPSEVMGKSIHSLVVPKSTCAAGKARIEDSVNIFSETGSGYFTVVGNVRLIATRKDGKEFPVELSVSPLKIRNSWSAVGVVKDITERVKAEENLRVAEQRYHALFDQAPIGVVIVNPKDAKIVEFNDVAARQLGYCREEFEKLSVPDIEAKEDKESVSCHIAEMIKVGGGEFETLHRTKDGHIRNVLVSTKVIKLKDDKLIHFIFHDITEIKLVEQALAKSEAQYRQLVQVAQEGVWAFDNDLLTTFVNPRMVEMLGYQENEILGKSIFDFVKIEEKAAIKEYLGGFSKGVNGSFEYELPRKDGTVFFAKISASKILNDSGNCLGSLALVADITERMEMEKKIQQYSKSLENIVEQKTTQLAETQAQLIKSERMAAIGELAGMIGHDLRNPLSGIKNAAYYLRKKNACSTAQEMLTIIDKCVDHSNKIINDLLDYSREIKLLAVDTTLKDLTVDSLLFCAIPGNIELVNNVSDETPIRVDAERLSRVIINLVKNAVDAMPKGGVLTLGGRRVSDSFEFTVTDTGIGIPEEVMPKLFAPLVTTKAQGMGFGLAICKRIVEAHDGAITVASIKGKGTTFTVTFQALKPVKKEVE